MLACVSFLNKSLLAAQAFLAQHTIRLDPEPPGNRHGTSYPADGVGHDLAPLNLIAVGDSIISGCGVAHQSAGITPRLAQHLANQLGCPISWRTFSKMGSTMRRVRYRFLEDVPNDTDILFISAASNDLLARRTPTEWQIDLTAALEIAQSKSKHVVLLSAGQLYNSPALGLALRTELLRLTDEQTAISSCICAEYGVDYIDLTHCELVPDFWAGDRFHPSADGYEMAAEMAVEQMRLPVSLQN